MRWCTRVWTRSQVRRRESWHPAGDSRQEAEKLAARLAAELNGRNDKVRSLTFGAYLTGTWLPGKKINLAASTSDGYRRKIERHILPAIGHLRIRRLRAHHLEKLYDRMLYPTDGGRSLAPKTVLEVHLIIRGALKDAEKRGLNNRNVALVAHAPKLKSIPKVEPQSWTAQQITGVSPGCGRSSALPRVLASEIHRDATK